jgi:hypothetical protein
MTAVSPAGGPKLKAQEWPRRLDRGYPRHRRLTHRWLHPRGDAAPSARPVVRASGVPPPRPTRFHSQQPPLRIPAGPAEESEYEQRTNRHPLLCVNACSGGGANFLAPYSSQRPAPCTVSHRSRAHRSYSRSWGAVGRRASSPSSAVLPLPPHHSSTFTSLMLSSAKPSRR